MDSYEGGNPANPKMLAYQKKLKAAYRRQQYRRRKRETTNFIPEQLTCRGNYKVPSHYFIGEINLRIVKDKFRDAIVFTNDCYFSLFCKLTIQCPTREMLDGVLTFIKEQARNNGLNPNKFESLQLAHCTTCYKPDHRRKTCNVCSYCLEAGHLRQHCIHNPRRSAVVSCVIPGTVSVSATSSRKRKRYPTWFRAPGVINEEILQLLRPVGPEHKKRLTIAVDTEGAGISAHGGHIPGNVNMSGYVGGGKGHVQSIYFNMIQCFNVYDPQTNITGNQIEDLEDAEPLEVSQEAILKIIPGKRVLVHGTNDLELLDIDDQALKDLDVEIVDTSVMFHTDSWDEPLSLERLTKFFNLTFWDRRNNTSAVQGHSPEKDARATLKIYAKSMKLLADFKKLPSTTEILSLVAEGKSFEDWKQLHRSTLNDPDMQAFKDLLTFPTTPLDQQDS